MLRGEKTIGFEIRVLSNLIKREIESTPSSHYVDKVTGTNGWVIRYLVDNQDRDVYARDFEEEFSIRRSTVSQVLKLMEEKGLIQRIPVHSDARLKKVVLTKKALEFHQIMEGEIKRIENKLVQGVSKEELAAFFIVMEKFKANLEEEK